MESWETAPIETVTPKQRRQREIRDREARIIAETGLRHGDTWEYLAVRVLANAGATAFELAEAVEQLDRNTGMDRYSHAHAAVGEFRARVRADYRIDQEAAAVVERRMLRAESDALDQFIESDTPPRTALRNRLLGRLADLGATLPNHHQRCCRPIVEAIRERSLCQRFAHLSDRAEYWTAQLADYGIRL